NGTTSSSTFTVIQNIVVDHTGYKEYTVPLPATTDDYFGFRLAYNNTSTSIDINIDNVHYEDIPPLLVDVDKTDILCNGDNNGSAIAIVEGGVVPYTYSWSPSLDTTDAISNLVPGQHTVTVTDGRGTVKTATVTILEPAPLVSNLNVVQVSCNGKNDGSATVAPSGGVAPYTVLWSDNTVGPTHPNLAPGSYSVDIRDANGCLLTETFTVTEPAVLATTVTNQTNVSV